MSTDANAIFLDTVSKNLTAHFSGVAHKSICADVRALNESDLRGLSGAAPDLIVGGPPCDDFTITGKKRGMSGPKGPLIFEFARLVAELRPKAFLFENVPNLAGGFRDHFEQLIAKFRAARYSIKWEKLSAAAFGDATIRERIFVIGFKSPAAASKFAFPVPTHGVEAAVKGQLELFRGRTRTKPFRTVGQALEGVPDVSDVDAARVLNHLPCKHGAETVERFREIRQGESTRTSFRYRADSLAPCRSLTAGLDTHCKAYIHPVYDREMTVREYARIHGFPDTWRFSGTRNNGLKQVANSVPIEMGTAVVRAVVECL